MTTFISGPVNIEFGNSAFFTVEFLDVDGNLTVPSGATMTVVYTTTSNSSAADSVTMTLNNSFYQGTWSSSLAALGLATWTVVSVDNSSIGAQGQIRVIDRQSD